MKSTKNKTLQRFSKHIRIPPVKIVLCKIWKLVRRMLKNDGSIVIVAKTIVNSESKFDGETLIKGFGHFVIFWLMGESSPFPHNEKLALSMICLSLPSELCLVLLSMAHLIYGTLLKFSTVHIQQSANRVFLFIANILLPFILNFRKMVLWKHATLSVFLFSSNAIHKNRQP